jgi:hypothetical protein
MHGSFRQYGMYNAGHLQHSPLAALSTTMYNSWCHKIQHHRNIDVLPGRLLTSVLLLLLLLLLLHCLPSINCCKSGVWLMLSQQTTLLCLPNCCVAA